MPRRRFATCLMAGALALWCPPLAASPGAGTIWRQGDHAVAIEPCEAGDHDSACKAVVLRSHGRATRLGEGYLAVRLLWQARDRGRDVPDLVLLGDFGGSGGNGDLIALRVADRPVIARLQQERLDMTRVATVRGRPRISIPFDIEFFNGAPHGGASLVPLPVVWDGADYALDRRALTQRRWSARGWQARRRIVRHELADWLAAGRMPHRAGTPETARVLASLMLSGHADQARGLLHDSWPGEAGHRPGGEQALWQDLCRALVDHPYWARFRLGRLPQAERILAAARGRG